ncbi:hypothetical protein ABVT39_013305 [Epinephelus coioides]
MKRVVAVGVGVLGVGVVVSVLVLFIPQTVQFRKTFMRRCEEFPQHNYSCKDTLDTFEGAYVDKEPFSFSEQNYDPLFEKIPFTHASSKTMLWSDTKALVHDFTKKRDCFITLEDTLLGFVMDGQKWCGLKGNKETFSVFCELVKNNNPVISFWKNASARFAAYASGEVTAMLNGGLKTPYNPNSIFASIEVKRLFSPKVTRLTIVLLTDKENVKKCNENESLQNLKNELAQKGILYSCKEVTRILALAIVVVSLCPFSHPPEKTVLWSNKEEHAQRYGIFKRCFTLESTSVGRFLEGLPKLISKDGEELPDNIKQAVRLLWFTASERIAKYSSEEVTVILDGDREMPFDLRRSCCSENNLRELRKALDPNISLTCEKAPWIMHEEISFYGTMYIIYNEAKKLMP